MIRTWKIGLLTLLAACGGGEAPVQETTIAAPVESAPAPVATWYRLAGRVLDPWSTPVAQAEVRALAIGAAEDGTELGRAVSDEQGNYDIELDGPGPYVLFARHKDRGFDRVKTRPLQPGEVQQAPPLRLAGAGILAGRVVDAAGAPLEGARIVSYSRELLEQKVLMGHPELSLESWPIWPATVDVNYRPGEGFQSLEDVTDAQGHFEFKGLIPGDYLFYTPMLGRANWANPDREWFSTGTEDLELRATLCILEVSVDQDGLPGSNEQVEASRRRLGPIDVFATVATEFGPRPLLGKTINPYADERNVFALEPGVYFVRAETFPPTGQMGATALAEGRIEIQAGDTTRRIKLEFPSLKRPTGRLRVHTEVPEGWDAPKHFHLLTPDTGAELECSENTEYPEPLCGEWLDMPIGEYVVATLPFKDFVGRSEVSDMGRSYRRVVVRAGQDTECTLRSAMGGSFRFTLDAERFVLDRDLVLPSDMLDGDQLTFLSGLNVTIGASLIVVREDGGPSVKLRLKDTSERISLLRKTMLPGETFGHFVPLEPGDYRIWAEALGFEAGSAQFTVTSGGVTDVSLRLKKLN